MLDERHGAGGLAPPPPSPKGQGHAVTRPGAGCARRDSRRDLPTVRPISGSRFGPKTISAITRMRTISSGPRLNTEPPGMEAERFVQLRILAPRILLSRRCWRP